MPGSMRTLQYAKLVVYRGEETEVSVQGSCNINDSIFLSQTLLMILVFCPRCARASLTEFPRMEHPTSMIVTLI